MIGRAREVFLTFDVEGPPRREDFIDPESLGVLYYLLVLLKRYELPALFFLTGSVAENLVKCPEILNLLSAHEIGYHSSSHSIRPRIFEYSDVESYGEAIEASIEREGSSIDLFTGEIVGKGGIHTLREIFSAKEITSFRAPFLCWSPPHLEALRKLGLHFDFSTNLCSSPSFYKGITFLPYPTPIDSMLRDLDILLKNVLNENLVVFLAHPSHTICKPIDPSYHRSNAFSPLQIEKYSRFVARIRLLRWESLLHGLFLLRKKGIIEVKSAPEEAEKPLDLRKVDIREVYRTSLRAPRKIYGCKPKFLLSHFYHFFEM